MANEKVGEYAFILGVVIAIVAGAVAGILDPVIAGYVTLVLVILGLIVGFLNIVDKQITEFLIAAIALIAIGTTSLLALDNLITGLGTILTSILQNVATFVAPAALIVALKAVYNLAAKP